MHHVKSILYGLIICFLGFSPLHALDKVKPGEVPTRADYDITDQERHDSQNFVHEGLSQRQMLEACAKLKDPAACQGNGETEFLGVNSKIIQAVSKAYSQFAGALAAGKAAGGQQNNNGNNANADTTAGSDQAQQQQEQGQEGQEGQNDYCVYIPMVGEQVGTFMQQSEQQKIEQTPVNKAHPQRDQLYKASRSHGVRAKTAEIQGFVWGATTACYAATMFTGKIGPGPILKLAGAGFLTFFWLAESKQQDAYKKQVKEIADNLPGVGDCNPITDPNCYCAQPETMYDPKYCLEPLRAKYANQQNYQVPCTTDSLESDPKCVCIGLDSCMDKKLFANLNAPGMSAFSSSAEGTGTKNFFRGTLSNASLNTGSNNQAIRTGKALNRLKSRIPTKSGLTKQQLELSDEMEKLGTPAFIARHLATAPTNSYGETRGAQMNLGGTKYASASSKAIKKSYGSKVMRFTGGKGIRKKRSRKSSSNSMAKFMKQFNKKKGKKSKNQKMLMFSNRARQQAEISRSRNVNILEIISRRYNISGRKRLGLE